jgi:hypothetical protein
MLSPYVVYLQIRRCDPLVLELFVSSLIICVQPICIYCFQELWRGYFQSIRPGVRSLLVKLDISAGQFLITPWRATDQQFYEQVQCTIVR